MRKYIHVNFFVLIFFLAHNINSQECLEASCSCIKVSDSEIRNFDSEFIGLINHAKLSLDVNDMLSYQKNMEKAKSILYKSINNFEKTIRTGAWVPQSVFDNSGKSWDEFYDDYLYTHETLPNQMLDQYPELMAFDVKFVDLILYPEGQYLTNCDYDLILSDLQNLSNNFGNEFDSAKQNKTCLQVHAASFTLPFNCNGVQGRTTQAALNSLSFERSWSIIRYDLISNRSTVVVHEILGHRLTLTHDDYYFDPSSMKVSVMYLTYDPTLVEPFWSEASVSKLEMAIPLLLSLAEPTDLILGSAPLEICESEIVLIEVSSNNGSITVEGDSELIFSFNDGELSISSNTEGTFNFIVSATNDAYCYSVSSDTLSVTVLPNENEILNYQICNDEFITMENGDSTDTSTVITVPSSNGCKRVISYEIEILPNEFIDTTINLIPGEEYVLVDGTVVSTEGVYMVTEIGAASNGCDKVWTYTVMETTSIEDVEKNILIYPNPVGAKLNVETEMLIETISITDINGQLVLSTSHTNQVDLTSLAEGVYFISVITKGRVLSHHRILKLN